VNKAAGVFDPDKLAWVNRHYMKLASPERLVDGTLEHFRQHAYINALTAEGRAYLTDVVASAAGVVDRLEQIPERFAFLFTFDPTGALARPELGDEFTDEGPREVVRQLAEVLAKNGRLDRERFRAAAAEVRQRTGRKGKDLFHPIRVALTGAAAGPELDIAVPLIERGAELPPDSGVAPVMGCRERAAAFVGALTGTARRAPTSSGHDG
jgi:nondiscriminating glutamyl-tRNA synthetase